MPMASFAPNPRQERLQDGGDSDFRHLVDRIATIVDGLGLPVMVKEVGWGISEWTASLLHRAGVGIVDAAGAGGTSWSEVEGWRSEDEAARRVAAAFVDWASPRARPFSTCAACRQIRSSSPPAACAPGSTSQSNRPGRDRCRPGPTLARPGLPVGGCRRRPHGRGRPAVAHHHALHRQPRPVGPPARLQPSDSGGGRT